MKEIVVLVMIMLAFSVRAEEDYSEYYFTGRFSNYIRDETDILRPTNFRIYKNLAYLNLSDAYNYKTQSIPDGSYSLVTNNDTKLSVRIKNGQVENLKILSSIQEMKKKEILNFKISEELKNKGVMEECYITKHFIEWHYLYSDKSNFTITKFYEPILGHLSVVTDYNKNIVGIIESTLDGDVFPLKKEHIEFKLDNSKEAKNYTNNFAEHLISRADNNDNIKDIILEIDGCKIINFFQKKIKNYQ